MNLKPIYIAMLSIVLCSCGSADDDVSASTSAAANEASGSRNKDPKSFVLCPLLESHRDELAAIVGFEQDSERALALSENSRKCSIRGTGGDFITVENLPAMVKSIQAYADSFDGPSNSAPELGDDAMFVDDVSQPRVAFRMGSMIISVYADYTSTPDRQTMIAIATRVREILATAN